MYNSWNKLQPIQLPPGSYINLTKIFYTMYLIYSKKILIRKILFIVNYISYNNKFKVMNIIVL